MDIILHSPFKCRILTSAALLLFHDFHGKLDVSSPRHRPLASCGDYQQPSIIYTRSSFLLHTHSLLYIITQSMLTFSTLLINSLIFLLQANNPFLSYIQRWYASIPIYMEILRLHC